MESVTVIVVAVPGEATLRYLCPHCGKVLVDDFAHGLFRCDCAYVVSVSEVLDAVRQARGVAESAAAVLEQVLN